MKPALKFCLLIALISNFVIADDTPDVDTTRIRASKELPKVLYVVPWKDLEARKDTEEKLVLHDFFGDLYEPVLPGEFADKDTNPN
jgi:hypothetical protein